MSSFSASLNCLYLVIDSYTCNTNVGLRRSGLTMASILIVCLAGASTSVTVEAEAGVTISVAEVACVFCLAFPWRLVSASPLLTSGDWSGFSFIRIVWVPGTPRILCLCPQLLCRNWGRPTGLLPEASSPYRKSLGMRPSGMRWTWSKQRSQLFIHKKYFEREGGN